MVIDGPTVNHVWWTDGYGDYIKHFLAGMAAVPEWAPATQSHLLRSSSIVRTVQYAANRIDYSVADPESQEVLRLNFAPTAVTADGVALGELTTLDRDGWTFDAASGILRLRHSSGTQIIVSGTPIETNQPPAVSLSSPAPNSYTTSSLEMSANASDADGSVTRVDFFVDGNLVGSDGTAPYAFYVDQHPSWQLSTASCRVGR